MKNNLSFINMFKFFLLILLFLIPKMALAQEICNNGIDDDKNGLIDLNDPNCDCEIIYYQSLLPNPSVENYSCCPTGPAQMECLNSWSQASAGTTDYVNLCDDWPIEYGLAPPFPIPAGNACLRLLDGYDIKSTATGAYVYKEYAGVCLNSLILQDSLYLFELYVGFLDETKSPDFNLSIYGSDDCTNLPFSTGAEYGCPLEYSGFTLLNSILVSNESGNIWKKISLEITPERDISTIVFGPGCESDGLERLYVYYLDDFTLNTKPAFDFQLLDVGSQCSADFIFAVKDNPNFVYQWYKEGIALVGETNSQLSSMYGEGRYQLRIINDTGCRVSDNYIYSIPFYTNEVFQTICEEDEFIFGANLLIEPGIYVDTFTSAENCDSIVTLNLDVKENAIDSFQIRILNGSTFEFEDVLYKYEDDYFINYTTFDGCDSLVILQLSLSEIYVPNAFSPNSDGVNDVFQIFVAEDIQLVDVNISIFNRWGELIYEGEKWDGTFKSQLMNSGVFIYRMEVTTMHNEKMIYSGDISLIR